MNQAELLETCELIGDGLQQDELKLSLQHCAAAEGWYWSLNLVGRSFGIWCSKSTLQQAATETAGVPELSLLDPELWRCILAVKMEPVVSQLQLDNHTELNSASLLPGIYPVINWAGCQWVLVNWSLSSLQTQFNHWSPFRGGSPHLELSLVAGWWSGFSLPPEGDGIWLESDIWPERGEAILWWNRPLAHVRLAAGQHDQMCITRLLPYIDFIKPPVIAELARVKLPIAELGMLIEGELLDIRVSLSNSLRLQRDNDLMASGQLLRSDDGLLVRIEEVI